MGQGRREGHEAHGTAEVKHGMAGRGQEMGTVGGGGAPRSLPPQRTPASSHPTWLRAQWPLAQGGASGRVPACRRRLPGLRRAIRMRTAFLVA